MLYDYPEYYELAFSFRDIKRETDFLVECIKKYSRVPVKRVFEVACGHAPHAGELTERGYTYSGLDINRNMLDYATYKWRGLKPSPDFVESDMKIFEVEKKADFAFVMLGSLYLNSLEEMSEHFDCMGRALRPGGLYFLDWCVQFADPLAPRIDSVMNSESNGVAVESKFNIRLVDTASQMYEEVWTVIIDDHGRRRTFEMIERNRAIYPQEFQLFLRTRNDFEFVGWWHDWNLAHPIDGRAEVHRPVVLIRRK